MPTAITLTAPASFTNPILKPLPAISGLQMWTYFGTDLAHSPNAGSAGALLPGAGSVAWAPNYVSCKGSAGDLLLPTITQATSETWMCVCRYTGGGTGGAFAQLKAPTTGFGALVSMGSTALVFQGTGFASPQNLVINGTPFHFYAMTCTPGGSVIFYDLSLGTQITVATGTLTPGSPTQVGIGGPYPATANDRGSDLAWMALATSVMTLAAIQQTYAHVKDALAARGIPGV